MSDSRSPRSYLAGHVRALPRSGIREFFDVVSTVPDVISLAVGEPGFTTPWRIREAAVFALERGATGYTANHGLRRLRAAIAEYLEAVYGLRYDPATEILVTVGVSEALDLAIRATVNPGDNVLFPDPSYVSYHPSVALAHGVPVPVRTRPENGHVLQAADLESALGPRARVLLLNYPANPTGAVADRASLEALAEVARRRDLLVVSDEIYAELSYDADHVSIATLPGMRDRTLFLHGLSKAWAMTGFRLGFACGPAALVEGLLKVHQYSVLCAPVLSQEAAIVALRHPTEVMAMRERYRERRNLVVAGLRDAGLPVDRPGGAFYVFPSVAAAGWDDRDFAMRLLRDERVAVVPGRAFGEGGRGHVRCSFAVRDEDLEEALARIGRFLRAGARDRASRHGPPDLPIGG